MRYNKLGVLGGMGPKATSVFFDRVVEKTDAARDQDHIDMIILNHATLPDRTRAILDNQENRFLDAIKQDINLLEGAGVGNIAMPCNTAHYFYDQIQAMTDVNVINMVEETVKEIYSTYGENAKVGILATNGTIRSEIYRKTCAKYNMELHAPNDMLQEKVMDVIYNDVKGGIGAGSNKLEGMIDYLVFTEKCSCVIIACTDLSCIEVSDEKAKYCIDAMDVLVEKSIQLSAEQAETIRHRA